MFEKWVPVKRKARLKEMVLAFVDGVNQYIEEATTASSNGDPSLMPVEYLARGLLPEPWAIEDSMAVVSMMAWKFGGTGGEELKYAAALQALQAEHGEGVGWKIFNDLYPQNDPGAEATIPSGESWHPILGSIPSVPSNIGDIYRRYEKARMNQKQLFESLGLPTKFGSNAWMVNTWKSRTKNAMQVGGPQMGHSIPQIVLEIGLHGAGIDAVGMMMPMFPTILIGVSEYGAWTSTTGFSDVMDTYIEVLNPENPYQYQSNSKWVDMEVRTERICERNCNQLPCEGKVTCIDKPVYRTIHGPIIAWDLPNNFVYTMKTPYYKSDVAAEEGWSLFQQARNIVEFQEAVKTVQPSHNFFWADRKGNIGFWHAGTFPIKPEGVDDRLPLWGTGSQEWEGLTGFEEMPKSINPKQGWLANWNSKPIADWPYAESDAHWGEGQRVKRIMDLLAVGGKFSFEDMNRINRDAGYNHIPGMNFLQYLVKASNNDSSIPTEVIRYLKAWDHHYNDVLDPKWPDSDATYDDPGLTIFERWYSKIKDAVFDDDLPEEVVSGWDSTLDTLDSTLIHVFDGSKSKLRLNYDYLNGEDRDKVIVQILKEALNELEGQYGTDISQWLTPVRTVTFDQRGALPAPSIHAMNRGTYNHIAEMPIAEKLIDWLVPPHAVDVIPPGQSGFVNYLGQPSPHAYDQLVLYETWTYKPMLFRLKDIEKVAESRKVLPRIP